MANVASLRSDAEEFLRLSQLTTRENVKRMLTAEADKLKQFAEVEEKKCAAKPTLNVAPRSHVSTVKLTNYGWDQSEKFVKIYVTLNNVLSISTDSVISSFEQKSLELQVLGLDNKNYTLTIKNLLYAIKPEDSYHKIKTDMIVVFLRKVKMMNWACVTEAEKKAKEPKAPKLDDSEDPSKGLMSLMKQMYDEGDDDMKRTIAKAWTEAREKKSPDDIL